MVDLHQHLLWGLDDGARDLETSVAMARQAVADGITHVVCTPHSNSEFEHLPERIGPKLTQLRECLLREGVPLTLGLGCDLHLSYDNVVSAKRDPSRFTINGFCYLLVELPDFGIPRNLTEVFTDLRSTGITCILTHPERNPTLQEDFARMTEWMRAGVLLQVTADSVTGDMGRAARRMCFRLLEQRRVHLLASDAHNTTSRPPRMRKAAALVAARYGQEYADELAIHNPRAIFEGREIKPSPMSFHTDRLEATAWWEKVASLIGLKVRDRRPPRVPAL